ncbi:hypothetical protein FACS1894195_2960 [Bacteroidia bacterium]|nr:hypothetical protein FACS1894195_2960 [Bacteroidia bacterium]
MTKIVLMGPISPPYHGQSVAFTAIVEYYRRNKQFDCIEINYSNKDGIISGLLLCLNITYKIIFNKIDLIYFTCSRSFSGSIRDVVMLFWARIFNIKVVNHLHGRDFKLFYKNSSPVYRKILKWCYEGVSESIVLLDGMKILFNDFPHMKVDVVANSYSVALDDYPKTKTLSAGPLHFLYLSNIMESKGILHLLDAFEIVFKNHSACKFTIAGDFMGDYISSGSEIQEKFQATYQKRKEKYPNQIDYIGVVAGKRKNDLLWQSDIFILPTFHQMEAFPISLLEALRAGNYIISTNHNYIPEIITPKNGKLIEPNSVEALCSAIEYVLTDKNVLNEIQNYNINDALLNYSEEKYIKDVTQIINENFNHNNSLQ